MENKWNETLVYNYRIIECMHFYTWLMISHKYGGEVLNRNNLIASNVLKIGSQVKLNEYNNVSANSN